MVSSSNLCMIVIILIFFTLHNLAPLSLASPLSSSSFVPPKHSNQHHHPPLVDEDLTKSVPWSTSTVRRIAGIQKTTETYVLEEARVTAPSQVGQRRRHTHHHRRPVLLGQRGSGAGGLRRKKSKKPPVGDKSEEIKSNGFSRSIRPFYVMLPKDSLIPPSGSSNCHNNLHPDQPATPTFYCHLDTGRKP